MNISSASFPLCSLDFGSYSPEPALFVVFGATGDLARRKIFPALLDLEAEGRLPEGFQALGFARRPLSRDAFLARIREGCARFSRHGDFDETVWSAFAARIDYLQADIGEEAGYRALAEILAGSGAGADMGSGAGAAAPPNALFYLAVGPESFGAIAEGLGRAGLGTAEGASGSAAAGAVRGWRRLVVEKPYGRDLESSRALTAVLQRNFSERDIYRIDHYLGKETVQNLLYLRFANSIFEPLWNRHHIESIQISVFETEGIGQRAGYYESAGAARDMLQNHLIQLLCLATMEPPSSLDPESIRDEKVKVLRSISMRRGRDLLLDSRRGQYTRGTDPSGKPARAYIEEERVGSGSTTETYVALRLRLDTWRFSGVPITLRTGKAFARRFSQIDIRFKRPPAALYAARCGDDLLDNCLTIRIQPDEGVWLRFNAKVPGKPAIRARELRFSYADTEAALPEAYERLISDALSGDSTLFIRADESEEAWRIVDALEEAWKGADAQASPAEGGLSFYPAGSPIPEGDL